MSEDPHAGKFLDRDDVGPERPSFRALGNPGSGSYVGLETFPNPGVAHVTYASDEVVAFCPITQQPDFYTCEISLMNPDQCIESKSLKIWLRQFNDEKMGLFGEALAVYIREHIGSVAFPDADEDVSDRVQVILTQKSRGGITIRSVA